MKGIGYLGDVGLSVQGGGWMPYALTRADYCQAIIAANGSIAWTVTQLSGGVTTSGNTITAEPVDGEGSGHVTGSGVGFFFCCKGAQQFKVQVDMAWSFETSYETPEPDGGVEIVIWSQSNEVAAVETHVESWTYSIDGASGTATWTGSVALGSCTCPAYIQVAPSIINGTTNGIVSAAVTILDA